MQIEVKLNKKYIFRFFQLSVDISANLEATLNWTGYSIDGWLNCCCKLLLSIKLICAAVRYYCYFFCYHLLLWPISISAQSQPIGEENNNNRLISRIWCFCVLSDHDLLCERTLMMMMTTVMKRGVANKFWQNAKNRTKKKKFNQFANLFLNVAKKFLETNFCW